MTSRLLTHLRLDMSHPFSPAQIRFGGYGIDDQRATWIRFWIGPPGRRSVVVRLADLNAGSPELWQRFGDAGFFLSPADRKFIRDKIPPWSGFGYQFKVVRSPGWSLGYVSPSRVFGAPSCIVEREFSDLDLRKYRSAGTLDEWQHNVLSLCAGNSRLMFGIMCAFAGPLLEILKMGNFGFQLFGPSSIGKTIILIVAGSVWGCHSGSGSYRGFPESWATTPEGVERYGRAHNHAFLPLNETRLAGNDRKIGDMVPLFIMRLAEGAEKNRLVAMGGSDWQLVYLGSSNLSLFEIFAAAGMDYDDAYRVRFPDIPADASCGYGAFENIHGFKDAAAFAKELQARACSHFGTASEYYLEHLSKDRHNRRGWLVSGLQRGMDRYRAAMASAGSAVDARITDQFAVVYAAGMLARHYGILPWSPKQIAWAVRSSERAHHQFAAGARIKLDPIAAVRSYITNNVARFRKVPDPTITDQEFRRSAGFIYIDDNGALEYAIPRKSFAPGVVPLEPNDVLRALDESGFLVRGRDKYVSKVPIRSSADVGRKFVCRIRGSILDVPA
jgi:putative DNA primase/helicase